MNMPERFSNDLLTLMRALGYNARTAAGTLATAGQAQKDMALRAAANVLRQSAEHIFNANALDLAEAREAGLSSAMLDRLALDKKRIDHIAAGLDAIAELDDPVGATIAEWRRPNGLRIERVRTPLGVIGVIYESRPNVTADAGGLCLKSGNAVILRGGSDSFHSSRAIHDCLIEGLRTAGLPEHAIQIVPTKDREAVGAMLRGLDGTLDVIVPRGGKSLVGRVQEEARVPVFAHLEGICHIYWDRNAHLETALPVVINAKMRRTGICGAAETLLVDQEAPEGHLDAAVKALLDAGCEVRGDEAVQGVDSRVKPATQQDWQTEYLDAIIAVKTVAGVQEAIHHIAQYGSQHTECILTQCCEAAELFLKCVDSAIVMHNASTQFADGGEFGMGAEIGIATGKMHARGPIGVEQLTTFKYIVRGAGQTRPS